jgi:hypothetical protein
MFDVYRSIDIPKLVGSVVSAEVNSAQILDGLQQERVLVRDYAARMLDEPVTT